MRRIRPEIGHRSAVIVDDHGQPGTGRRFLVVEDPDIERGVIGLPDLVRVASLPSIEQVVLLAGGLRPGPRQGDERRIECADDRVDAGVARNGPATLLGNGGSLAVDDSRAQGWPPSGKALDQPLEFCLEVALPSVRVDLADESRETMLPILLKPALRSAEGDPMLPCDSGQRHALLEVQAQALKTLEGACAGRRRELCQGGRSAIQEPPRLITMSQKRGSLRHSRLHQIFSRPAESAVTHDHNQTLLAVHRARTSAACMLWSDRWHRRRGRAAGRINHAVGRT